MLVFCDRVDNVITQSFTESKRCETDGFLISYKTLQSTTKSTHPDLPGLVTVHGVDIVVGKVCHRGVLVGFEQDGFRLVQITIETHQSVNSTHPYSSLLILRDVSYFGIKSIGGIMPKTVVLIIEGQMSICALFD